MGKLGSLYIWCLNIRTTAPRKTAPRLGLGFGLGLGLGGGSFPRGQLFQKWRLLFF